MRCILVSLVSIILIIGCKKEINDSIPIVIDNKSPNIEYTDIQPDTIVATWVNGVYLGEYDLDINSDGINDFKFSIDLMYGFGGAALGYCDIRVNTLNENSFILSDSINKDEIYPKIMSCGDTIQLVNNWKNGRLQLLYTTQKCCPPENIFYTTGIWKNIDKKSIAIKYKNRYGWITMGISNYYHIKIYEYAISKK